MILHIGVCVLLSSTIDCVLFVMYGTVTGVHWAGIVAMDNEHVKASIWVGFSFMI